MQRTTSTLIAALLLGAAAAPARAAFLDCDTASPAELESAMAVHNEHIARLEKKFADVWYFQGSFPEGALPKVDTARYRR